MRVSICGCKLSKGGIIDYANKPFVSSGSVNFQLLAIADNRDQSKSIIDLFW